MHRPLILPTTYRVLWQVLTQSVFHLLGAYRAVRKSVVVGTTALGLEPRWYAVVTVTDSCQLLHFIYTLSMMSLPFKQCYTFSAKEQVDHSTTRHRKKRGFWFFKKKFTAATN